MKDMKAGGVGLRLRAMQIVQQIIGKASFGVLFMRRIIFIFIICLFLCQSVCAALCEGVSPEDMQKVLLRLLSSPAGDAITGYYGEPRQFQNAKLLSIRKVPDTPFYEVVMQAETFYGPHNPPYGTETMTFYIRYGELELRRFEHRDG